MSNILPIITHPNDILRQKAAPVVFITPEIQTLINDMVITMNTAKGLGLAAPQIGKSLQLFVANVKNNPLIVINPVICQTSFRKTKGEEGCLSLPGSFGIVKRHHSVTVQCQNLNGEKITFVATGLLARVCQHEIDHLNGILFIDKAVKMNE